MMHGRGKSDSAIVAVKPTNKAERSAAEPVEPRAGTKGNAGQQSTCRAQSRVSVSQALERIRQAAKARKKEKFTSLFHHISIALLAEAFSELKEDAAPGIDGLTWWDYGLNLERNLEDLHARIHRGAYQALPSRRVYIPKPDGRQRPLAVAALEDKIVQRATAAVLNAIYEEDFLGFTHSWVKSRKGKNVVRQTTAKNRFARSLARVKDWCRTHRHLSSREQHAWLTAVLNGHFAYYGITGNIRQLQDFRYQVVRTWHKWLARRTRGWTFLWNTFNAFLARHPLPAARIVHRYA